MIVYNFETIIVERDDQSKVGGKLRKNKDKSFAIKTSEHITIVFALAIYSLEDVWREMNIFVILLRIAWKFLLKRWMKP